MVVGLALMTLATSAQAKISWIGDNNDDSFAADTGERLNTETGMGGGGATADGSGSGSFTGNDVTGSGASKYQCPKGYAPCGSPAVGAGTSCQQGQGGAIWWSRCQCDSQYKWYSYGDQFNCDLTDGYELAGASCTSWPDDITKYVTCQCKYSNTTCDTSKGYQCNTEYHCGGTPYCVSCTCISTAPKCGPGQTCTGITMCNGGCSSCSDNTTNTNPDPSFCTGANECFGSNCCGNGYTATSTRSEVYQNYTLYCSTCGVASCPQGSVDIQSQSDCTGSDTFSWTGYYSGSKQCGTCNKFQCKKDCHIEIQSFADCPGMKYLSCGDGCGQCTTAGADCTAAWPKACVAVGNSCYIACGDGGTPTKACDNADLAKTARCVGY